MGNMSYCRFENTLRDLDDCYVALRDGELEEFDEQFKGDPDANRERKKAVALYHLCKRIVELVEGGESQLTREERGEEDAED